MTKDKSPDIDLSGRWSLATLDGRHATTMAVPGDVHSALQAAGIIPDPYHRANELVCRWVADEDWRLTTEINIDGEEVAGSWYLDIDYLDTVATVLVNGSVVLQADNCFRRYRPEVGKALRAGANRIEIILHSPVRSGKAVYDALPFEVPWLAMNCPIPYGNMLRKPQCHFGWDWNIALAPSGLYGTVKLRKLADARIEHVTTRQHHRDDGSVDLEVTVTLHSAEPAIVPLHLALDGERVRLDCGINEGTTIVRHVFSVDRPALWWPAGHGPQALSELVVDLPNDVVRRQIGFRTVELLTDPDPAGSRFALRVNGVEIFAKGANWIPADALFSKTSPDKTLALLQSAVDANMNMIRIWGGGFYEHDWFYDLCDQLGLMVWQDFMFACNLYPSTDAYLANVAAEVDYQVRRLSTHASIVLWCGDNELVGALNWFDCSRKDRDRYLVSYDRLNRTIETAMKAAHPDLIWWPSSPSCGLLNFGDAWHADGSGDMHFWSVWHENKSFDHYRTVKPRFCSEFGFQSYTSMQIIDHFAEPCDLNIASPVMEIHQKNPGGNERIAGTMFRYFRFPKDFANFVYLSQIQQGLAIQTAVDYWRSLKPHCMGTIIWQLNDTWPVASWASLDHGGNWKALHFMARRFFAPVQVAAFPEPGGSDILFSAVNDTAADVAIDLAVDAVDMQGRRNRLAAVTATVSPDRAGTILRLDPGRIPAGSVVLFSWTGSDGSAGQGHHVVSTYKVLELDDPALSMRATRAADGNWDITVSAAAALALFVTLESAAPGRFSDNVFDLAAGESRTIRFVPDGPCDDPGLILRDLHSCQTAS